MAACYTLTLDGSRAPVAPLLRKLGACASAVAWVRDRDLLTAWRECARADWMLWICGRMADQPGWPSRRQVVLAACVCAERALRHLPEGDGRPAAAITMALRWAWRDDKITLQDIHPAADAAYAAAADAASAAAAYAAYAAYAAAAAANAGTVANPAYAADAAYASADAASASADAASAAANAAYAAAAAANAGTVANPAYAADAASAAAAYAANAAYAAANAAAYAACASARNTWFGERKKELRVMADLMRQPEWWR